jgi:hypothetical protein
MKRILIHGATILTLDPKIGDLRGDISLKARALSRSRLQFLRTTPKSFPQSA